MITPRTLEFAAGLILGEGSFSHDAHGRTRVSVAQAEREPLEWLRSQFGGTVSVQRTTVNRFAKKTLYVWRLSTIAATGLMMSIYGLLAASPRRQAQIREVLKAWRSAQVSVRYRNECPQGHEYTEDNTRRGTRTVRGRVWNIRECRVCVRENGNRNLRIYRARRRLAHALLVAV